MKKLIVSLSLAIILLLTTIVINPDPASADVNIGESFAVTLEYCPSTGFAWTYIISNPDVLEFVSFTSEPNFPTPPDGVMLQGGSYYGTWTFKTVSKGVSSVTFKYKQGKKTGRTAKYTISTK